MTDQDNKSKGLGDTVSKVIKKVTGGKVEECEPCRKRREKLNKLLPYRQETTYENMTDEEIIKLRDEQMAQTQDRQDDNEEVS